MRWLFAAALLAGAAQAQLPPASETIEVNVVEIDVAVLDGQGKPVPGLRQGDFDLRVGGRRTPITNFYEVNRRAGSRSAEAPVARRDYLVLFVDDLHLQPREKKRALDALRTFVAQRVGPGTAAMLVASDGDLRILQRFTEDPAAIARAIDAVEATPAGALAPESERRAVLQAIETARRQQQEQQQSADRGRTPPGSADYGTLARQQIDSYARHERENAESTIAALKRVVHDVQGLDGRRVLVYVSDGLPLQPAAEVFEAFKADETLNNEVNANRHDSDASDLHPQTGDLGVQRVLSQMQSGDAMNSNLHSAFLDAARQAALAGVQFFAIDARGVRGFDDEPRQAATSRLDANLIRANLTGPMRLLADETGGEAIVDTNDLGGAFARLDDRLSSYYSIGFRSEESGREDDVLVSVRRRGVTVRAVKHVRHASVPEQIADRVRAQLYARMPQNPLDATVSLASRSDDSGLIVTVRVPVAKLSIQPDIGGYGASFWLFVTMMDDSLRETPVRMFAHRVTADEPQESVHSLKLDIPPGKYTLSFAVADAYSSEVSYLQRDVAVTPPAR